MSNWPISSTVKVKPADAARMVATAVKLPPDQRAALVRLAAREKLTVSAVVRNILARALTPPG